MRNDTDRIRDALVFIDATDRNQWVIMGMAIKSELGDSGFNIWKDWSQQAASFNDKDAQDVWKSIRVEGGVTIGTLFHQAKKNGWQDDGNYQKPTPEEFAERRRLTEKQAVKEEAEIIHERTDTAAKAKAIWSASSEARTDHPYLVRKQVSPIKTLREIDAKKVVQILGYVPKSNGDRLNGRLLIVPVKQGDKLSTVELIDSIGYKAALAGRGSKVGGYWVTEQLPNGNGDGLTLLIGEGMATVLSASVASGYIGIAALSSGNLPAVARTIRQRYPKASLVVLADLVKASGAPDPNAIEAAQLTGGRVAIPDFGVDRDTKCKDFNDMMALCGLEAVSGAIVRAIEPSRNELQRGRDTLLTGRRESDLKLIRASDITPEPINWLWKGWLASGKMHILAGAPGTGKTTISMELAAIVTIGGYWPDGSKSIAGNVIIWSGEDDLRDTLIPRLTLAGADLSRVYFISEVQEGSKRRSFDPARDIETLRHKFTEVGDVRLLIIDPLVSAIAGDSHKNAEVRRGLQPLFDLAALTHCALLGITHFSKGTGGRDPVERLTGSLAFGALSRIVMVAAKHQTEGEDGRIVRLFCRAKSNIGEDGDGFEYDLHEAELKECPGILAPSISWGKAVHGSTRELLAAADAIGDDSESGTLTDAKQFLVDLLASSSMSVTSIKKEVDLAGFSWVTIRRAKKALGIKAKKCSMKGGWEWQMPVKEVSTGEAAKNMKVLRNSEDAQLKEMSIFRKIEPLQNEPDIVEIEI